METAGWGGEACVCEREGGPGRVRSGGWVSAVGIMGATSSSSRPLPWLDSPFLSFPNTEAAGRGPASSLGPVLPLSPPWSPFLRGAPPFLLGHLLASLPFSGASTLIYCNNKDSVTISAGLSPFLKVGSCLSSHWILIKNTIVQGLPWWCGG